MRSAASFSLTLFVRKPSLLGPPLPVTHILRMSTPRILGILEAANIEPHKARAIAESLELAFRDQEAFCDQEADFANQPTSKNPSSTAAAHWVGWQYEWRRASRF